MYECSNCICLSTCSYLPGTEANELVTLLSEIITGTKEKSTCSHALWCLGKQGIASDIISSEVGLGVGDSITSDGMFSYVLVTVYHQLVCSPLQGWVLSADIWQAEVKFLFCMSY